MTRPIRKQVNPLRGNPKPEEEGLSVPDLADVLVMSESPDYPIHHVFDGRGGPGGTRWVALAPGDQTIVLAFGQPQSIRRVTVEVEEVNSSRTQEMTVAFSRDGGQSYMEVLRQEYTFSPPGRTFEHEEWVIRAANVTHLRLWIRPDKSGTPAFATLTTLRLE
jgi:hypothetical protein